jgi:hypothetical protein
MANKYKVFGLVFESPEEIPGLYKSEEPTDITISYDRLPDSLGDNAIKHNFYEVNGSEFLLKIDRIGKIYADNGNKIIIDNPDNVGIADIRLYLFGTVIGAIAHQRKMLPLHTSAINYGGKAILFGGISGAGKSSITAELNKRGFPIIGDDTILVNKDNNGNFFTYHGAPEIKLWQDVAEDINHLGEVRYRILDKNKYRYDLKIEDNNRKYPISRLYNISPIADKEPEIIEPVALQKIKILKSITYRLRLGYSTGNTVNHFKLSSEFTQKVSIKKVIRPRTYIKPSKIAEMIVQDLENDYGKA